MKTITLETLRGKVGQEIGLSDWTNVTQARIDAFAEVTNDHQFIHVDPVRAAETPFGSTIAHGFLTLSLLTEMYENAIPPIEGTLHAVNYGLDRIRFLSPVKSGARIRGRFVLKELREGKPGEITTVMSVKVEIEGEPRPALAADWIGRRYLAQS
ncbi:MaoC family dehydratase [Mesobacterium pallidum]|uniref:MaoC family dehydratase n=1 Tax=Mesobacterium pallidum TaxID=2872037 RepID=UPI001EE3932F|nr:MaoC family dehydratase [Mesobacterium pallidum]